MLGNIWILVAAVAVLFVAAGLFWRPMRAAWREARLAEARRDFHRQRERLEAKFVQLAAGRAKPDGPQWADCEFDDDVAYVRSRSTGEVSALVAVTVHFEGVEEEPGPGERNLGERGELSAHASGSLRAATAVFRFDGSHWETDGRAIFNLTPSEAIHLYRRDFEMIGQEVADRPKTGI